jgi:GNAT superfamily N-acetyltransferase
MEFADIELARRLERAEGRACVEFAEARRRLFPESGTEWMECGGAFAVYGGVESPITQTFGLGIFEELTAATLDEMERFFFERGAAANHEVSPLAGVAALRLLCDRGYRPIEISSVMWRPTEPRQAADCGRIRVRAIGSDEAPLWADVSARGWTHQHPELLDFLLGFGVIAARRQRSICFLAEYDGTPGAAGALSIDNGVALFAGAATVPELRRRGLQAALLEERLGYAHEQGCDLAMMVAEAGGESQRNAERKGFRVAYTRVKWQKAS